MLHQIAADENAGVIDVHAARIVSKDFPDNLHPNDAGAIAIAKVVYAIVTGKKYDGEPPAAPQPDRTA